MKTFLFREKNHVFQDNELKKHECTQNFSSVAQKVETLQVFYSQIPGNIKKKKTRDSFDGTTGNSRGGAELAQGGGFSCKNKTKKGKTLQ